MSGTRVLPVNPKSVSECCHGILLECSKTADAGASLRSAVLHICTLLAKTIENLSLRNIRDYYMWITVWCLVLVNTPLHISGVEQVVSLLASGLSQIGGVELLDSRILMGLTDWVGCIYIIEHLCAQAADIRGIAYVSGLLGLSAAVYTAARTSHDLDEVVVLFPGFDRFEDFLAFFNPEATQTFSSRSPIL